MARTTTVTCDYCGAEFGEAMEFINVAVSVLGVRRGEIRSGWAQTLASLIVPGDYCDWRCLLKRLAEYAKADGLDVKDPLTEEAPVIPNPPQTPPRGGWIRKGGIGEVPTSARPPLLPGIPKEVGP